MTRDLALVILAGVLVLASLIATVVLVRSGDVPAEAALGPVVASVGLGGVALGRLSGAKPE